MLHSFWIFIAFSSDLFGPSLLGGIGAGAKSNSIRELMPGFWLGRKLSMMAFLRSSPRFSVLVRALELTELSPSLEVFTIVLLIESREHEKGQTIPVSGWGRGSFHSFCSNKLRI